MKVTVIQVVIGEPGTVTKGLIIGREGLEIRGQVETVKITALLTSDEIKKSPGDSRRIAVNQTLGNTIS